MDDSVPTAWQNFLEVITHPFTLLQSLVEYTMAWFFTRPWRAFLPFAPALLVVITVVSLVGYGWTLSNETLVKRYSVWADESIQPVEDTEFDGADDTDASITTDAEVAATEHLDSAKNDVMEQQEITPFAELLLRRLLSLEKFNNQANYLVAAQMGMRGRVGQARYMMRQIAPTESNGYAPAHAWLSVDRISRLGVKTDEQRKELLHDLENASTWSGTGPSLLAVYADVLESVGRVGDAIAVLTEAVRKQPELQVKLANMAYRHDRKQPMERASTEAKTRIEARIEDGNAGASDYASMANLMLLDGDTDKALEAAQKGLQLEPDSPALKRLVSEAYRMKYVLSKKSSDAGTQVNLGFLDAAMKADPSNPSVSQEVAALVAMGAQAPPDLKQALDEQLLDGKATAVTHLLVAISNIKKDDLTSAIAHLELALRQAPSAPVILNNLAVALARTRPEQLPRCIELIDKAVALVPGNAEYRDSQGEIRALTGDLAGAIESYEAAIRLDEGRVSTRRKLAAAYREFGLVPLAEAQLERAAEIENQP